MGFITFRRHYLDQLLMGAEFRGKVIDVGGKKENRRGAFQPPLDKAASWEYVNTDPATRPDYACSAEAIPVPDQSFDVAVLTEVLEHLERPERILAECFRILKTGGRLVASMPFLYAIHADPHDYQRWTPARLERELRAAGFTAVQIQPMGGLFAVVYDLFFVALNAAANGPKPFAARFALHRLMPAVARVCRWADRRYAGACQWITTGYFVTAMK